MTALTQRFIDTALTSQPENRILWDKHKDSPQGFGVKTTASGTVSYFLNYWFKGKERRIVIGRAPTYTLAEAREEAHALRVDINNGHDPLDKKNDWRDEPSFASLADAWLEDAKTRKRESSLYDDCLMLGVDEKGKRRDNEDEAMKKKRLLTAFGDKRLSEIRTADIVRFKDSLKSTPYAANRALALLSSIFNYGIRAKWVTDNPTKGVPKYHEDKRERFLKIEETRRFVAALDQYPREEGLSDTVREQRQDAANALALLLLTGAREGEVLGAQWEEFNLDRGEWVKPSHHTKQKKTEHTPLSAPTMKLLRSMGPKRSGPLFAGRDGEGNRTSLRRAWIAACRAAGLAEEYTIPGKRKELARWRPVLRIHDLRHSYASLLISNGVSLQVAGRLLGHTQASTTMRYAHVHDEAQRTATAIVGEIVSRKPSLKAGKRRR